MKSFSRRVQSNQNTTHPDLQDAVRRHFFSSYKKPLAPHSQEAFEDKCGHSSDMEYLAANAERRPTRGAASAAVRGIATISSGR